MPREALRSILPIAGWSADRADTVTISGGTDPSCRRRSASAPPARRPWPRPGSPPPICGRSAPAAARTSRVDVRQATASLRSGHYMKLGDGEVSHARNSIMGVYPTKDGRWSYLHCNFPNHRAAALERARRARKIARRSRSAVRTGTPPIWRRRSSPPRAPAAWCARRRNGRGIRRPPPSPRCR